jgi:hypothetical protein
MVTFCEVIYDELAPQKLMTDIGQLMAARVQAGTNRHIINTVLTFLEI